MILTYASSRASIAKWYWRSLRRDPRHLMSWLIIMAAAFLLARSVSLAVGTAPGRQAVVEVLAVMGTAVALALYPQLRFKPQIRTLSLSPEEIRTSLGAREETYSWSDVATVTTEGGSVIITFRNLNAFIVPPQAFGRDITSESVAAQCEAWRRSASARGTV
jgi:hypothetical protein